MKARRENDQGTLNKLDRQISKATSEGTWPEIRADSATPGSTRPVSKAPEPEHLYIKPSRKDWEA
jgi:hypothetical protein